MSSCQPGLLPPWHHSAVLQTMPFVCAEQRQKDKAAAKALHDTLQRASIQEDAESPDQQEPVAPQAELHQEVRQPSCTNMLHSMTQRALCGRAPRDCSCLNQAQKYRHLCYLFCAMQEACRLFADSCSWAASADHAVSAGFMPAGPGCRQSHDIIFLVQARQEKSPRHQQNNAFGSLQGTGHPHLQEAAPQQQKAANASGQHQPPPRHQASAASQVHTLVVHWIALVFCMASWVLHAPLPVGCGHFHSSTQTLQLSRHIATHPLHC